MADGAGPGYGTPNWDMLGHPEPGGALDGAGPLVLTVTPADGPSDAAAGSGLSLSVEGVIVGDDRRWSRATFRRGTEVADDPPAGAFELVVDPAIDQLAESIRTAPSVPGGAST